MAKRVSVRCTSLAPRHTRMVNDSGTQLREGARVIVLGAGLAGLRCAQALVRDHGVSKDHVILLEASTRLGGRIKTDKTFLDGFSLDLGAELIHGDETSLYRLAKEKGWEMEELISLAQGDGGPLPADSNDGFGLFYLGGEKRMLAMDSKDPDFVHLNQYLGSLADLWPAMKFQRMKEDLEREHIGSRSLSPPSAEAARSAPNGPLQQQTLSLRDGLREAGVGAVMLGVAEAGYANTVGAALEDTSLMGTCFLEHEWDVDGDRTFVLKGSLGQVVEELSTGLESCIQTGWPVASVDYSAPGPATVTCRDGRIERGTHVVSALPLSVLQDGDVAFSPPLPDAKISAFQRMGLCSVVKVVLKFDRPVLPTLLHGCICSESFIPEFWFRHMPDLPRGCYTMLAVGFAAGPWADAVTAIKPEDALKRALDQLDDMFGGRKWLKGGGCTGKGDWEGKANADSESSDPAHDQTRDSCQRTGHCDTGREKRRQGDGLDSGGSGHESVEKEGSARDPPRHSVSDEGTVEGASSESRRTAELPSAAYTGGLVHDWVRDEPFVRGGYSYPRFGFDENTHADAAAGVNGTLFFAGEHTNTPTGMTVHAAIDSGERAAREVLIAMKENSVCPGGIIMQAPKQYTDPRLPP